METRLEDVQQQLRGFIYEDTILVGHSLESDLKAMKVGVVTWVRSHACLGVCMCVSEGQVCVCLYPYMWILC